mmetsp:Transcript_3730/g.4290  ORF Transcript_3730/g.4290 Transcript_3730/m.4290 type:complete len:101 (+) Transcript_3730:451-753(+)
MQTWSSLHFPIAVAPCKHKRTKRNTAKNLFVAILSSQKNQQSLGFCLAKSIIVTEEKSCAKADLARRLNRTTRNIKVNWSFEGFLPVDQTEPSSALLKRN